MQKKNYAEYNSKIDDWVNIEFSKRLYFVAGGFKKINYICKYKVYLSPKLYSTVTFAF